MCNYHCTKQDFVNKNETIEILRLFLPSIFSFLFFFFPFNWSTFILSLFHYVSRFYQFSMFLLPILGRFPDFETFIASAFQLRKLQTSKCNKYLKLLFFNISSSQATIHEYFHVNSKTTPSYFFEI